MRPGQLQTRQTDDGTGEIEGLAVPWGTRIEYAGLQEEFARGAISPDDAIGTILLDHHKRDAPIGVITHAEDTEEGLTITAKVSSTSAGRDLLQLGRDGIPLGLSVGFQPIETREASHGLVYEKAMLAELSVVSLPAYRDARITATREEEAPMTQEPTTDTREAPAVDLAPIQERMEQLESLLARRQQDTPSRTLSVREAFAIQVADTITHKQVRALGDAISSGNAGVLPPDWSSMVRGYLDGNRWLASRLGTMAFPATGQTLTVPDITVEPTVANRGTELTEIPGAPAFQTGSDTFTAQWLSGGQRIAIELLETSSPEIGALIASRLLLAYSQASDKYLAQTIEAEATPTTAVLDFTDYGTFVAQVIDAAETIRAASGTPGDRLALTTASWKSLLGLVDADGRRVLSTTGAQNADGAAPITSTAVDVGGVLCFHSVNSQEDMQFSTATAAFAEKPPMTLTETNVDVMGRSIGVLGAVIALPLYPAGILVHSAA